MPAVKNTTKKGKTHHYFSDRYRYTGGFGTSTLVRLVQYNTEILQTRELKSGSRSFRKMVKSDCVNWFQVTGLTDSETISRLLREFGMHTLDARDILTPNHVVKIDDSGARILVILKSCFFEGKNSVRSEHIGILVKNNVVISFTEREESGFSNIHESLKSDTMRIRQEKSGMLLAFLLNTIFSDMIDTVNRVESVLERIEDTLLKKENASRQTGTRIQQCRHAYLIIRKSSRPLKEEFPLLLKSRPNIIDRPVIQVFRELSDQLEYIVQTVDNSRDLLNSLESLYVSDNDLKMNRIMKRLTVVATLFIPTTFLVGYWGMNFETMPEYGWKYGYPLAILVIAGTFIATGLWMKKKKWF